MLGNCGSASRAVVDILPFRNASRAVAVLVSCQHISCLCMFQIFCIQYDCVVEREMYNSKDKDTKMDVER